MTTLHKAAREALETKLHQILRRSGFVTNGQASDLAEEIARFIGSGDTTLRAALDEAPGEEREAFEAWWAGLNPAPYYPGIEKEIARNAWQARAMLAARPSVGKEGGA